MESASGQPILALLRTPAIDHRADYGFFVCCKSPPNVVSVPRPFNPFSKRLVANAVQSSESIRLESRDSHLATSDRSGAGVPHRTAQTHLQSLVAAVHRYDDAGASVDGQSAELALRRLESEAAVILQSNLLLSVHVPSSIAALA